MRLGLACLVVSTAVIAVTWFWLGSPEAMPQAPVAAGEKLYCVSYAPFRGKQTPLDPDIVIPAPQIEQDLIQLAGLADCVRIYAVDQGLDQVVPIAAKHGLKVLLGVWLSNDPVKNKWQIDTAVALADRYPDTVRAVVVGNEVLLRGDMTAENLASTIGAVKARVHVPVTYADVWEYWLRNRDVAAAADFVTIHILPYWEDFPISCARCRRSCRCHPPQGGGCLSRQGGVDRRGRLAERRTHARGRAAVAGQPGARDPGCAGAGCA